MRSERKPSGLTPILLLTHGDFGQALLASAQLVVGQLAEVYCFALHSDLALADYVADIERTIPAGTKQMIVLTDVFGASPSHAALLLTRNHKVAAFSGLSMPLLLAADEARQELAAAGNDDAEVFKQVEQQIAEAGAKACVNLTKRLAKSQQSV